MRADRARRDVVAVVHVADSIDASLPTVLSLRSAHPELEIFLAGPGTSGGTARDGEAVWSIVEGSVASAANELWRSRRGHVLVVTGVGAFPLALLERAVGIVEDDVRVATVSFFSNGDGLLALAPTDGAAGDLHPEAVSQRLRAAQPDLLPAPIPFAAGPAVLVSTYALSAVGPLSDVGSTDPEVSLVEFSLRARRKGFSDVVDPSTLCTSELGGVARALIEHGEVDDLLRESDAPDSPLSTVRSAARAKVFGLRVLLDGACLGPLEMGTQVQTLALIAALARHADVAKVSVALFHDVPDYASAVLANPKVDARKVDGDLSVFGPVDIGHQPFQPDGPLDVDSFAPVASRSLVSILDLIAYHGRSYQLSGEDWRAYRRRVRRAAAMADGVTVPAEYVRHQVLLERLPIDADRLFTVTLGTDHLRGDEAMVAPAGLPASALLDKDFVLVLGADYTHKNRDLAIKTVAELRRRGFDLTLVMVGASVFGSSQALEAAALTGDDRVRTLADVSSGERNWLLRHASLLLYPTSAEGFGLVPFEAARFGTPTVLVSVGPLKTIAASLPVVAPDWDAGSLAAAAEALLADSALADEQVQAALEVGDTLTWDATAAGLVEVYRSVLALPRAAAWSSAPPAEAATARRRLDELRAEHEALRDAHQRMEGSTAFRVASRFRAAREALRR